MKISLLSLAAIVAMSACALHPGGSRKAPEIPQLIMEWKGQTCGVDKPSSRVIRNQEEWLSLWRDIGTDPPETAFAERVAIAVFLGQKPTGGYGVKISDPRPEPDGSLVIEFETIRPTGFTIQMLTQPYTVRVFDKTDAPLIIREAAS